MRAEASTFSEPAFSSSCSSVCDPHVRENNNNVIRESEAAQVRVLHSDLVLKDKKEVFLLLVEGSQKNQFPDVSRYFVPDDLNRFFNSKINLIRKNCFKTVD